jgi:hypothetical protein
MKLPSDNSAEEVLCPSAQPEMAGSRVFAVVAGTVDAPRSVPLAEPQPVTAALLALAGPVNPTEQYSDSELKRHIAYADVKSPKTEIPPPGTGAIQVIGPGLDTGHFPAGLGP